MRVPTISLPAVLLILIFSTNAGAQQSAQESAAELRAQLATVQAQQADLQARLAQLDEAMKPENIASSLAGVGSTRPEELREQRRRVLEKEKAGVNAQLSQLALSQRRLESAIATADAAAYHQSAQPIAGTTPKGPNASTAGSATSTRRRSIRKRTRGVKAKKTTGTGSQQ